MAKKRKYGNPVKEKAYREAKKRANDSKVETPSLDLFIGNSDKYESANLSINGIKCVIEVNELVKKGLDTLAKYHRTLKDTLGKYEFIMEKCDNNNVYVTVQGTPYKHSKMSKKRAYWEWDFIWTKFGTPNILAA